MQIWEHIKNRMLQNPNQTVEEKGASITYEDLIIYAELLGNQIKDEKCCAVYCKSEMANAMAVLGCLAAGVTVVPLSFRYGFNHCKKILNSVSPTGLLSDLEGGLEYIQISDSRYNEPESSPAVILFTSGSTGVPKGVMLSSENLLSNLSSIEQYFPITKDDSILITRSLFHSSVLTGEFLISLCRGLRIRFMSEEFNPQSIVKEIVENSMTVFGGTPTMFRAFFKLRKEFVFPSLKKVVISGECLSYNDGKKINELFPDAEKYHVYGLTEASPRVCWLPPDLFFKYPDHVGIPIEGVELMIDSKSEGEAGELFVRGKNVMLGYYDDDSGTKRVIDKKGWLKTGDIVKLDNGLIKVLGRKDDMIIRGGMNIYPSEIEAELLRDERVKKVVVFKYRDSDNYDKIGIDISGDFESTQEVKELCIRVLPLFQIPSRINLCDEIGFTGSNKTIRRKEDD